MCPEQLQHKAFSVLMPFPKKLSEWPLFIYLWKDETQSSRAAQFKDKTSKNVKFCILKYLLYLANQVIYLQILYCLKHKCQLDADMF